MAPVATSLQQTPAITSKQRRWRGPPLSWLTVATAVVWAAVLAVLFV